MSYRSAAVVAVLVPLAWSLAGAGCSDSSSGGGDAGATTTGGFNTTCMSDKDCTSLGLLCDTQRLVCVQCITTSDCGESEASVFECTAGACVSYQACENSLNCGSGQVCDKQRSRCVECTQDGDCAMGEKCVATECHKACTSDKDCQADKQLCDFSTGTCATCLRTSDCPTGTSCVGGSCKQQLCTPAMTSCVANGVAVCSSSGDAWINRVPCPDGCTTIAGVAVCAGEGGVPVFDVTQAPPPDGSSAGGCGDLIDNMEDGDGYICRGNGRVGQWYSYGSNITPLPPGPAPTAPISPAPVVPPRSGSAFAMHLAGSSITAVTGSALGVDLQLNGATYGVYDASVYSGISFYAKGNVNIDVLVDSGPTTLPMYGGSCLSVCTPYQTSVALTPSWTLYTVSFATLVGGSPAFDKGSLTHIQFRVASATLGADLWIDDLSFFR
jgi:hypothetical protein